MGIIGKTSIWSEYFSWRAKRDPHDELKKTVTLMGSLRGTALDIGAGPLVNSKYLLDEGFDVTAVERESLAQEYELALPKGRFKLVTLDIRDFRFIPQSYDLVCAQRVLVYIPPRNLTHVLDGAMDAVKEGGHFCANFFGEKDFRNDPYNRNRSIHTKDQAIQECVKRKLKIVDVSETCEHSPTSNGTTEQTHSINIIARKER